MKIIDTHAHLDFPQYNSDRAALIGELDRQGIGVVNIATSIESVDQVVALAKAHEHIWAMIGLHPTDIGPETIRQLPELLQKWQEILETEPKVAGIGEIGLDYFHDRTTEAASRQKGVLRQFLTLALEQKCPVTFHCRDAYGDLLTILADYPGIRGVIHCYNGTVAQAKSFLELGMYLSFTGLITYPKNEEIRQVVQEIPLEKMLVETDSPFLPVEGKRGERNDPRAVWDVAAKIAEVKGLSIEDVAAATTKNALEFFDLTRS